MPNIKSAKKRVLTSAKKEVNNNLVEARTKTSVKKYVKEVETAKKLFNLDEEKIDKKELLTGVAIINAFIVATTFIVVDIIGLDKIYWFIAALAVILVLIVVCYFIYGKILYWKWGKDKKNKKL